MAADLNLILNGTPVPVYLGENTALALAAKNAAELAADVLTSSYRDIITQVADVPYAGPSPVTTGTTTLTGANTRLGPQLGIAGNVSRILFYANAAGTIDVRFFSPNGANYDFEWGQEITVAEPGLVAVVPDSPVAVAPDWRVGFYGANVVAGNTGLSGSSLFAAGDITGSNVAFSPSTAVLQMAVELEPVYDLRGRVENLTLTDKLIAVGKRDPESTGSWASTNTSGVPNNRIFAWGIEASGRVERFQAFTDSAGIAALIALRRNADGAYTRLWTTNLEMESGANDIDLSARSLLFDGPIALAFVSSSVQLAYSSGYLSSRTYTGVIGVDPVTIPGPTGTMLEACATIRVAGSDAEPDKRGLINDSLADLSRFAQTGTWTADADGAVSSGSGVEFINHMDYTVADRCATAATFVLDSTADRFGVVRRPNTTQFAFGTVGLIDFDNEVMELRPWDGSTSLSVAGVSAALTITPTVGRAYNVELKKNRGAHSLTITDTVTQETQTISVAAGADTAGRCWGRPGVITVDSAPIVRNFSHRLTVTKRPRLLMLGDSITEGMNLGVDVIHRESDLLETAIGATVINSARGGADSRDVLDRIRLDLLELRPEYVRLLIGTNERSDAVTPPTYADRMRGWAVRTQEILANIRAIGAVPILATLPPNGDGMTFINDANALILSRAFGPDVLIVDYAAALSVGNDRETLNASLFLGDETHPNVSGHAAMAAQFAADCPMVFD